MDARLRWLSFLSLLLALLGPLPAQGQASKFALEAAVQPATAKPGEQVTLLLTATVATGWHAYGTKETVNKPVALQSKRLQLGGLELVGAAEVPPGDLKLKSGATSYPLPSTFVVKQLLKVPADHTGGEVTIEGALDYQICDVSFCLAPSLAKFTAKLNVQGGRQAPAAEAARPSLQLGPDEKIAIGAHLTPGTARAGQRVTLVIDVKVDDRYHAYGTLETTNIPVTLDPAKLELGGLELAGEAEIPPGEKHDAHGAVSHPLPQEFQVKQALRVPAGTKPGTIELRGTLDYQLCDESSCDLAAEAQFTAKLVIEAGAVDPAEAAPVTPPPAGKQPKLRQPKYTLESLGDDNALTGSLWSLILLSIGGGLFALVMPCTYPMIPITFSFFTKQADLRNGRVLPLALTYGVGIVLMFVLIGVAVGGPIIKFAGHWATNIVIGGAFVVFALSLFGFFTLQLPAFINNAAGRASTTGGTLGVFLMGATLVISSFTCTAPIVGALLAGVAEGGYGRVALGMAVFGLTMAAPFVFLALLPGRVKALPKSGEWMNTLKISLGFVELAAALKFFSNVDLARGWHILPREVFLMIWAFLFVALALFLFGMMGYRGIPVAGVSKARNGSALASMAFAFYCLFGAMGFTLDPIMTAFEPPYRLRPIDEHTIVKDDHDGAMSLAAREDKLVLVNFTGFT
jgi:thiol:disulfide interchange protein